MFEVRPVLNWQKLVVSSEGVSWWETVNMDGDGCEGQERCGLLGS